MSLKIIRLTEGESYRLTDNEFQSFSALLRNNSSIPAKIKGKSLFFDDYTIGSITAGNTSIIINPRIKGMKTNDYFEMQLYVDGIETDNLRTLLGESNQYGMEQSLINLFLSQTLKLTRKGLEGQFINKVDLTNIIHGRILVEQIQPIDLLRDRVPVEYSVHSLKTTENKIIKLALDKCRQLIQTPNQLKKLGLVSSYFEDINVFSSDYKRLKEKLSYTYTSYANSFYPLELKLAQKIIEGITLNMRKNELLGSSYLVNSNNIFESYGRKVIKNGLRMKVEKWKEPRHMAKFLYKNFSYYKSYIPDILLGYQQESRTTYALLDTKNKDISDLQNAAKLPDLYQVIFYCQQLHTNYGGLVYPSTKDLPPIRVNIDKFSKLNFYIFSINFTKPIKIRNREFVNNVKKVFYLN